MKRERRMSWRLPILVSLVAIAFAGFSANTLADDGNQENPFTNKPSFIHGEIIKTSYDGSKNDLLTGGLGKSGLAGSAPTFTDPKNPTASELRTLAIYNNYRALVDISEGGGYGVLYGPNITINGKITDNEGLIAGDEFLAFADNGSGRENITMMVQVPATFNPLLACIITAPSPGSRGVYGAIATAGEWGLKHGCAVAYTDKGTGTGAHNLQNHMVNLIQGQRVDADTAGKNSNFTTMLKERHRQIFNAKTPNRFAFKHAHSQLNPEKDWGKNVLQSIEFAFFVLNKEFGESIGNGKNKKVQPSITPDNTIVIASSVSNGGAASIRAAEQDKQSLIDGVAVSEPNVNPVFDSGFRIVQGNRKPVFEHSRSLYDYTTMLNVYQGCVNRDPALAGVPLNMTPSELGQNRCVSLHELGLLQSTTPEEQATEAQRLINDFGLLPEQNIIQPSNWFISVPQALAVTYANAYARQRVENNLCDYSFGATDLITGKSVPLSVETEVKLFSVSTGIPPTPLIGGVDVINNASVGEPKRQRESISPSSQRQDENLDGALCLRSLATGIDVITKNKLTGQMRSIHAKLTRGIEQVRATGNLHGIPTVIVTGRNDQILPPNHTSRAYFGLNQRVEGEASNLRYYEVTNAQHLDTLNASSGFDNRFIPLHYYLIEALDLMFAHLTNGTPLPPNQVIHTTPRGGTDGLALPISDANLPPIAANPDAEDLITFTGDAVLIPE